MKINNGVWCKSHLDEAVLALVELGKKGKSYPVIDIYEFGVDEGLSIVYLKKLLAKYGIRYRKIFGFDAFEGLPDEHPGIDRFYLFEKGFFNRHGQEPYLHDVDIIKGWFSELNSETVKKHDMKPASIVHIDSDLYISARQALDFMFSNKLVSTSTILTYDEFKSTEQLWAGGESLAHKETAEKYLVEFEEFYRNEYFDRILCWQNSFFIKNIGDKCNYGV